MNRGVTSRSWTRCPVLKFSSLTCTLSFNITPWWTLFRWRPIPLNDGSCTGHITYFFPHIHLFVKCPYIMHKDSRNDWTSRTNYIFQIHAIMRLLLKRIEIIKIFLIITYSSMFQISIMEYFEHKTVYKPDLVIISFFFFDFEVGFWFLISLRYTCLDHSFSSRRQHLETWTYIHILWSLKNYMIRSRQNLQMYNKQWNNKIICSLKLA